MDRELRILILEDVDADAELMEQELRRAGISFSAERVKTREDFRVQLKRFSPDLILADDRLPHFDGMAALELTKRQALTIPVTIVTGSIGEEVAVECIKKGAAGYVIKTHLVRLGPAVKGALELKRLKEEKAQVEESLEEIGEGEVLKDLPHGREIVLVVEDYEEVRKLAVRALTKQGYKVLEAANGSDALQLWEKHKGPIHLIVTDVVMPGMSGPELAERLMVFYPEIRALYMSGYTDGRVIAHGLSVGGANFIQKPFTVDGLARKVRDALKKPANGSKLLQKFDIQCRL